MVTDLRQSDSWARYLRNLGWKTEEIKSKKYNLRIFIREIPLVGSVIKLQRPAEIPPISEIDRIAKEHRALLAKIEPLAAGHKPLAGFEPDRTPNLPTKTIVVDLDKSEEKLWKNLSHNARQSIRKANGSNLKLVISNWGERNFEKNLKQFHQLLKQTGERQKFWTGDYAQLKAKTDAFGKDALVLLVSHDGQQLAGALILLTDGIAYYHHTASNETGQKLFAPYFLMWEIYRFLKAKTSVRRLELEGIADPRFPQTKRWEGFTVFKRKWGGEEIEFPIPMIKIYHPLVRALFTLSRKIPVV